MLIKLILWSILIGSIVMGYLGIQSGSAGNATVGISVIIVGGFALYFLIKMILHFGFIVIKFVLIAILIATIVLLGIKGCQFLFEKGKEASVAAVEKTKAFSHEVEQTEEVQDVWQRIKSFFSFSLSQDDNTVANTSNSQYAQHTSTAPALPKTVNGVVSEVRSGYLIRIGNHFIKLYGIDAPDPSQTCLDKRGETYECGRESKKMLERLVLGKNIQCQTVGGDYSGNYIATCTINDFDVGASMITVGWAVADRQVTQVYIPYEDEAHKKHQGLWSGKFVAPWEARAQYRQTRAKPTEEKGFWESLLQ